MIKLTKWNNFEKQMVVKKESITAITKMHFDSNHSRWRIQGLGWDITLMDYDLSKELKELIKEWNL